MAKGLAIDVMESYVIAAGLSLTLGVLLAGLLGAARHRNVHRWIRGYALWALGTRTRRASETVDIFFCMVDHFEPYWNGADQEVARRRVALWTTLLPGIASKHRDSEGRPPVHTFFYPAEQYDSHVLDSLAALRRRGFGDVEVHLHHDGDTDTNLRNTLLSYASILYHRHGLLRKEEAEGRIRYGFVHGDWALDNSREDGRCCGVNNELSILVETGCYADFTFPSAPSETQTMKVNSIYFAEDDPGKPKSHDWGEDLAVGRWRDDRLLIVQGPLLLNFRERKFGVLPRIENGEISADNPVTENRVALWVRAGIGIHGVPNVVFVKVHTHGAQDANARLLLGGHLEELWAFLERRYNDGSRYRLHYVSAYDFYMAIRRAAGFGY